MWPGCKSGYSQLIMNYCLSEEERRFTPLCAEQDAVLARR
jgi:hypothetical protein